MHVELEPHPGTLSTDDMHQMPAGALSRSLMSIVQFRSTINSANVMDCKRGTKTVGVENSGKGMYGQTNVTLSVLVQLLSNVHTVLTPELAQTTPALPLQGHGGKKPYHGVTVCCFYHFRIF